MIAALAPGGSLIIAAVTAVSLLLVRAALLRRRELAADRHAAHATGNPDAMAIVLRAGTRPVSWAARLFATHPTASDRLAPDGRDGRWDGGFVFTAAAGIVAMLTYHGVYAVLADLLGFVDTDQRLSADVALAVAALLWTSVVLPAWTRRAATPQPRWAGSWAGAVFGLVAGFCLQAPVICSSDPRAPTPATARAVSRRVGAGSYNGCRTSPEGHGACTVRSIPTRCCASSLRFDRLIRRDADAGARLGPRRQPSTQCEPSPSAPTSHCTTPRPLWCRR
ncbi:hypothetical protein [Amycolatopsis sp. cmx-4-68]|uniref:hypothetical protein n=1 Tax=Amycolatopsis sp. cmx-4-68 TaxID=2790938 RepID=UPI0039799D5C